jgi:ribosomal protein S18 acetylase RimI-like enzyme
VGDAEATHRIVEVDVAGIDVVEELWRSMLAHHAEVTAEAWSIRNADDSWRMRRAQYEKWLSDGTGQIFTAVPRDGGAADGYAVLTVHPTGPTFDHGEQAGDLESLAVSPAARGAGVGTLLIDHCRQILLERGVGSWIVTALDPNVDAQRLYEREGFRPFARILAERLSPAGE